MSDPRRPDGSDQYRRGWSQPTEPMGNRNAPYNDPAYAGQYSYPSYMPPNQTEALPPYWTQTQQPTYQPQGEPPEPPRSPRWLWLVAAAAVLVVVGLVIALVIADGTAREDTMVAPLTTRPEPTATITPPTTTPPPSPSTTTSPSLSPSTAPSPTVPLLPTTPAVPGASETVEYTVDGEGRAISITYVDSGGVLQMEFNVVLPWSKEVRLTSPASSAASVTVLNVGREVTCTVSVDGTQVRERSGTGLTICASIG